MKQEPPPLRIFISHTSEFAKYPQDCSFLDAARNAIYNCGHALIEQESFSSSSLPPADVCRAAVCRADIYLALLGHRYGSKLPGEDVSYTEFEFNCARDNQIPQLIFLLSGKAPVPVDDFADAENAQRQARFRARAGTTRTVAQFDDPADLRYKISLALSAETRRINSLRSPARVSRDELREVIEQEVPEAARYSDYLAALLLSEKSQVPATLNGAGVFASMDVIGEIAPQWPAREAQGAQARLRAVAWGDSSQGTATALRSAVAGFGEMIRQMVAYLDDRQADPAIRQRIAGRAPRAQAQVSTTYSRPHVRKMLDSLREDQDWPEVERQASRWINTKDPVLRRKARAVLLTAIEAYGQAQASRAASIAAGFAAGPDAECIDVLHAAIYADLAGDRDAARRYAHAARQRWPQDLEARRLEIRLFS